MRVQIVSRHTAGYGHPARKVTCTTCKLKKCVGNCRWEAVDCPREPNGKAA
jgi:hypothetical protein